MTALDRLVTYGTLAPGRPNHHQLDGLIGRWLQGSIRGRLVDTGWGAALGYPALILDPAGEVVDVDVFESTDLGRHWARLDRFEGAGYQRKLVTVDIGNGSFVEGWIYTSAKIEP